MKIDKTEVFGFEAALRGMRNPLASHAKSDSYNAVNGFVLGNADLKLAQNLIMAGSEHCKFMRQIAIWVDLTLPLYVWKEFDQYRIGVTTDSCSTMHKITSRYLDESDFEFDMIETEDIQYIARINELIKEYRELPLEAVNTKEFIFRKIVQKLPSSYLQKRTVSLNYAVLRNIWLQRHNHKLKEWHKICEWIQNELPYGKELITL